MLLNSQSWGQKLFSVVELVIDCTCQGPGKLRCCREQRHVRILCADLPICSLEAVCVLCVVLASSQTLWGLLSCGGRVVSCQDVTPYKNTGDSESGLKW